MCPLQVVGIIVSLQDAYWVRCVKIKLCIVWSSCRPGRNLKRIEIKKIHVYYRSTNIENTFSFHLPETLNRHVDVPALLLTRHSYVPLLVGSSLNFSSGVCFRSGMDMRMNSSLRSQRMSVRRGGLERRTVHLRVTI